MNKLRELNRICGEMSKELKSPDLSIDEYSYLSYSLRMILINNKSLVRKFTRRIGIDHKLSQMAREITDSGCRISKVGAIIKVSYSGESVAMKAIDVDLFLSKNGYKRSMRNYDLLFAIISTPDYMSAIAVHEALSKCKLYSDDTSF